MTFAQRLAHFDSFVQRHPQLVRGGYAIPHSAKLMLGGTMLTLRPPIVGDDCDGVKDQYNKQTKKFNFGAAKGRGQKPRAKGWHSVA